MHFFSIQAKRNLAFCLFQHKLDFDPTASYAIEGLKPDTLYKFQLGARSDLGLGVYTPVLEARTAQSSKCLYLAASK